ncbi:MAG: YbaY family lipoprotein [Rhodocyclaceae bacterium]|nr:YbaY family lipoprotein [Rhodocyclaceae bacterium]
MCTSVISVKKAASVGRILRRSFLPLFAVTMACTLTDAQAEPAPDVIIISGTAAYRQRIAMPPNAELTVRIEDVSRADAKAVVLAKVSEIFGARQVPIPFNLAVPRTSIDSRGRYSLRATVTVDGRLRFTTDKHYPVSFNGASEKFNLQLVEVAAALAVQPKLKFDLPASFSGVLPCADCQGVAQTLTLRSDGLYQLRRTYIGKPGEPIADIGRWTRPDNGNQLVIGRGEGGQRFEIVDRQTLRQLDRLGQTIHNGANLNLRRLANVDPITETVRWRGEFVYMADAATYMDCASRLRWPVAMAGDYLTAERRYSEQRTKSGAALLVNFDGHLEMLASMEGPPREHLVIDRLESAQPGGACATPLQPTTAATASLRDTYWKLTELDNKVMTIAPVQQREVRLTLASGGNRAFGFSGCNQFSGRYEHVGASLRFSQLAGTMMACTPNLMELEAKFLKTLGASGAYRIDGERLSLLAGDQVLARFEAVYLR